MNIKLFDWKFFIVIIFKKLFFFFYLFLFVFHQIFFRFTPEQILATCLKKSREIAEQVKFTIPLQKKLKYWLLIAHKTSQRCDKEEEFFAFLRNLTIEFKSKNQDVVKTIREEFPIMADSASAANEDE